MTIGIIHTGCTDFHRFKCALDKSKIEKLLVSYAQRKKIILEKTLSDCTIADNVLTVPLSQEETLLFDLGCIVEVQARVKYTDGTAGKSCIVRAFPDELLNSEVL